MKRARLSLAALLLGATLATTTHSVQGQSNDTYRPTIFLIDINEEVASPCEQVERMELATLDYLETHRRGFQQSQPPTFIFATRNNRFSLALGGEVALRAGYDFDGVSDNLDFVPYDIATAATPLNRQQLVMDASTSRLHLKGVINSRRLGRVVLYVGADFRGGSAGSYTPRLRSAYVSMLGLTFGRDVTTFCDLEASPTTIDFAGPNAYNFRFATLLRYHLASRNERFSGAVALEMPTLSATYNDRFVAMRQRVPDIPIYIQWAWDEERSSHLRLSAVLRNLYVRDVAENESDHHFGWGVQLSGTIRVVPWLRLYMNGTYGRAITPYIQDLMGSGLDMLPSDDAMTMEMPTMWGWQAAMRLSLTERLCLSGGYSTVDVERDDALSVGNIYRRGDYLFGNLFYALSERMTMAAEYLYGSRKDCSSEKGHAHRVQMELRLRF